MLANFLFNLSFKIREHPARFLYSDFFFNLLGEHNNPDAVFLKKNWGGNIWDVGASVGKYTTLLADYNREFNVYAFEPNLNSLYYLGYRTAKYKNVIIVPCALTLDGAQIKGSYHANFHAAPTGPLVASISLSEAIQKFGKPHFIKLDVEGYEYDLLINEPDYLHGVHMLVEWHPWVFKKDIPQLKNWKMTKVTDIHTYLEPV